MGAIVLDGARVQKHGFVGSGELWLGNPGRCVHRLSDAEIEGLYYSAQHYVRLKDRYLAQGG
jgi:carbonic anhydrase/acetyltransferase-like protein (isoleucine patch superfamily)